MIDVRQYALVRYKDGTQFWKLAHKHKCSHMSKDNPIKKHQFKSGESGNPTGRSKGSLNRKTVAREYLALLQEEVNPLTGIKELLSNEDR